MFVASLALPVTSSSSVSTFRKLDTEPQCLLYSQHVRCLGNVHDYTKRLIQAAALENEDG